MTDTETRPLEDGWLADTPVEDSLMRRFVFNQASLNALVAEAAGGSAVADDEVFLADAHSPVAYLNQAILARPVLDAGDEVFDRIESFFDRSGSTATLVSVWPTPDLVARGWTRIGHPMLVVRAPGPIETPDRDGVAVRTASTDDDYAEAVRVLVEGYPIPEAAGAPAATVLPPATAEGGLRVRIGTVDGEPAAVGNCYVHSGVVNLCLAATTPAARRRGVWSALVRARIGDDPSAPAMAFTSDDSRPGFVRMGFLPMQRLTLWAR